MSKMMTTVKSIAEMTTEIVITYLHHNQLDIDELPKLIEVTHGAVKKITEGDEREELIEKLRIVGDPEIVVPTEVAAGRWHQQRPALPIDKSVTPDWLYSLEDGRRYKMLKGPLRERHNMTPEQYRAKWGLPDDYPMVAPNYSKARKRISKDIGLGKLINRPR